MSWPTTSNRAAQGRVTVAIVDTGVDQDHPDLIDAPIELRTFNGRSRRDNDAHGTHVTGLIGATSCNGEGIEGACRPARLLCLKALGPFSEAGYYRALRFAIESRTSVLNLSFIGDATDTERSLIRLALRRGVCVVAAMGNEGRMVRRFPAAYRGVIAVGASTNDDRIWPFSNRGRHIDLVAPGVGIWSTVPRYRTRRARRKLYDGASWNGTSLAAAFVAAAVARLRHLRPEWDVPTVRRLLHQTCDFIDGQSTFTVRSGWGRLNLARALEVARSDSQFA